MLSFSDVLRLNLLVAGSLALAEGDRGSSYDGDLTRFVTRPDIKAPLYNITRRASSGIVPGYWFLAPYANIYQEVPPENYYQPCSTGPHIYDGNGDLVWSSACQSRNQNGCDFRLHIDEHGNERLSVLFVGHEDSYTSRATVMDNSYTTLQIFDSPEEEGRINMHELNIVNQGRSAIYLTGKLEKTDIRELGIDNMTVGSVSKPGIREVEIDSGKTIFEWWSRPQISILESTAPPNLVELSAQTPGGWNWLHPNSVDKDEDGNYLLSGRFADTIYKIDGQSGEILWRLGGRHSSFRLDGFNFSKQHDARFISSAGAVEVISFFDNAKALHPGMNVPASSNISSALVVELNSETKVARVLRRITRPDGKLTELRGNFQLLPDDNAFVSWAGNGYISEHGPHGELLLEAKWVTERFVTYRAYKYNFTAQPSEPPILKAFTYGETPQTSTTVWYASWNGATEVAEWHFYRTTNSSISGHPPVGVARRRGFETTFISDGPERYVYAEAVDVNGRVLSRTQIESVTRPNAWKNTKEDVSESHIDELSDANVYVHMAGKDEL